MKGIMNQYKSPGHHAVSALNSKEAATVIANRNATKLYGKGQYQLVTLIATSQRRGTSVWLADVESKQKAATFQFEVTEL